MGEHAAQGDLAAIHGAYQIGIYHGLYQLGRLLPEVGARVAEAGVVDPDVDLAEVGLCGVPQALYLFQVGYIAGMAQDALCPVFGGQGGEGGLHAILSPSTDDHGVA